MSPDKTFLGKVAKFGGHSLNGFEVIPIYSERLPPPGLNIDTSLLRVVCFAPRVKKAPTFSMNPTLLMRIIPMPPPLLPPQFPY